MGSLSGYVRVSKVGGRGGEGFISPDVQERAIRDWSERTGNAVVIERHELDVSGGTMDRPVFNEIMEKIRAGKSDGIVVYKLDRFSRSLIGAVKALADLGAHDAVIASATEPGLDYTTPAGRAFMQQMFVFSEFVRSGLKESWATAAEHAIGRGVHISPTVPLGYDRDDGGRLIPNDQAPIAAEIFRRRGEGEGWGKIAAWLNSTGVEKPRGTAWIGSNIQDLCAKRVYRGEASRYVEQDVDGRGPIVNPDAHPALVTEPEWRAAQMDVRLPPRSGGGEKSLPLLSGLIRCAACRYSMSAGNAHGTAAYRCRRDHASGRCPEPAIITREAIEGHVEQTVLAEIDGMAKIVPDSHDRDRALAELDQARRHAQHRDPGRSAGVAPGVEACLQYPRRSRRRQARRIGGEHEVNETALGDTESLSKQLENSLHQRKPQQKIRHEARKVQKSGGFERLCRAGCQLGFRAGAAAPRQARQRRRRHRHAEEADRQQIERLGVEQGRDRTGGEQGGEQLVEIRRELNDSPPGQGRAEGCEDLAHRPGSEVEGQPEAGEIPSQSRKLNQELQDATDQGAHTGCLEHAVRGADATAGSCRPSPRGERSGGWATIRRPGDGPDDRRIPENRREIRQKKLAVTVAHAQRPGRKHQCRGHRKDPAHRGHRQLVAVDAGLTEGDELAVAQEAGGQESDDRPCEEHAERRRPAGDGHQEREDRPREPPGLVALAGGQQARIDRDERRRERLLAEQVLQQVGQSQRGAENVGVRPDAEEGPQGAGPEQARQPAAEDAGGDGKRPPRPSGLPLRRQAILGRLQEPAGFFASQADASGRTMTDSESRPEALASAFRYQMRAFSRSLARA